MAGVGREGGPPGNSLFESSVYPADAFCEAFRSPAAPRAHWKPLVAALEAMGADALRGRQERADRMRREDGATFNPFDDPVRRGLPWSLEPIPIPITAHDWAVLEAGLLQRVALLEQVLADVYGPQHLLGEGRLPAELIFANPRFIRSCHAIQPAGGRYLTFYAADIYRDPDGRFRVFRDYGSCPAGIGYALENRIVTSRLFADLFHKTQVRRLAPFFHAFHMGLLRRASLRREDPGIVLLSMGPESRIYFEQAFLSRYLGYPLVEGQDLTVRNGRVFLKKLAGLDPVEAIFRHIDDDSTDPVALRKASQNGVAGLIQACREQFVEIVNPIGSGFVDTPVLPVFLPALCRHLTGAELELENHPSLWCGDAHGCERVVGLPGQYRIGSALEPFAEPPPDGDMASAIKAKPHQFMGREPLRPAVAPAWSPEGIVSRFVLLRVFACATETGYTVMPGGLAITAPDLETLAGDDPHRQQSKDMWVLSDHPVEPFSLMEGLQKVPELRRGSDLPSRVADHLLWLGRYLERAEDLTRLLRSVFRRLSGEAKLDDISELPYLLSLLRSENTISGPADGAEGIPRYRELWEQLNAALFQQSRPESVVAILKRVQGAARSVRDRLSLDSWRVISRLEGFADQTASDPLELLDDTLFTLSAFSGLAMESMTRGLGWRFMDMGRRVERAIHQAGLIRIGLPQICGESRTALEALLEVSDSIMTYRARYRTTFQLAPVLDLLIVDESNPKSLAFQCNRLVAHVEHLPRQTERRFASPEERMTIEMLTSLRLLDLSGLDCSGDRGEIDTLTRFLKTLEGRLGDFSQQISAHYLSRIPAMPHFSAAAKM